MWQVLAPVVASLRLLRRHVLGWLVAVVAVQGTIAFVVLQMLGAVFQALLDASGDDGLNQTNIVLLLLSPVELCLLLLYGVLAVVVIVVELAFFAAFAAALWDGAPFSFGTGFQAVRTAARPLWSWQAPLLALYVVLIVPLAHVGIGSVVTQHIAIPKFISGELMKTTAGAVGYWTALAVLMYVAFRLLLTVAYLTDAGVSVWQAMRSSWRATWKMQGRLLVLLTAVLVVFVGVLAVLAVIGFGVVALVELFAPARRVVAAVMLVLVGGARFVLVGLATVFLSAVFVALRRQIDQDGPLSVAIEERRPVPSRATRRLAATFLAVGTVVAVLQGAGMVIATTTTTRDHRTVVIAHRGYVAGGVENTLPALRAAARAGADMVEMDVQETRDGGFVVVHDTDLQRLSGRHENVYDLTTNQAAAVTVRQNGFTATIPTLAEYVREAQRLRMPLLIEVKPHGHEQPRFAERLSTALYELDPENRDWVQSLDRETIDAVQAADPDRTTAFVVGLQIGLLPQTTSHAVVMEDWSLTDAMISGARARDQAVFVWTINDRTTMQQMLQRQVDGMITDEVAEAVDERRREQSDRPEAQRYADAVRPLVTP